MRVKKNHKEASNKATEISKAMYMAHTDNAIPGSSRGHQPMEGEVNAVDQKFNNM